jgi:hypothetical protein
MRPFRSGLKAILLGLMLVFATAQIAAHYAPAHAAIAQTQKADTGDKAKSDDSNKKGKAAGNGSSASGKAEGLLIAQILLLLIVGRLLGEVMQRFGQPSLMGIRHNSGLLRKHLVATPSPAGRGGVRLAAKQAERCRMLMVAARNARLEPGGPR